MRFVFAILPNLILGATLVVAFTALKEMTFGKFFLGVIFFAFATVVSVLGVAAGESEYTVGVVLMLAVTAIANVGVFIVGGFLGLVGLQMVTQRQSQLRRKMSG
jgi:hypothetical protein